MSTFSQAIALQSAAILQQTAAAKAFTALTPQQQAQYIVTNKAAIVKELVGPEFSTETASVTLANDTREVKLQKLIHAAVVTTIQAATRAVAKSSSFLTYADDATKRWLGILNGGYALHTDIRSSGEAFSAMLLRLKAEAWAQGANYVISPQLVQPAKATAIPPKTFIMPGTTAPVPEGAMGAMESELDQRLQAMDGQQLVKAGVLLAERLGLAAKLAGENIDDVLRRIQVTFPNLDVTILDVVKQVTPDVKISSAKRYRSGQKPDFRNFDSVTPEQFAAEKALMTQLTGAELVAAAQKLAEKTGALSKKAGEEWTVYLNRLANVWDAPTVMAEAKLLMDGTLAFRGMSVSPTVIVGDKPGAFMPDTLKTVGTTPVVASTKVKSLLTSVPTWGWIAGGAAAVVLLSVLMRGNKK